MSENTTVVVFTKNNARIIRNPNPEDLKEFSRWPNAVIDPDLRMVEGHPPHYWKLDHGTVSLMGELEREERLEHIKKYGADNFIKSGVVKNKRIIMRDRHKDYLAYVVIIFLLLVLIHKMK